MRQYLRKWELRIDGEPFIQSGPLHNFRMVFDITISTQATVSFADIRIYNLAKTTAIEQGKSITLKAGYEDNFDTIFAGTITNVLREREGPSTFTRILCSSASQLVSRGSARSSYGAGATVTEVITDLARQWPLSLELDPTQFADAPAFTNGYVADGDIPTILDQLAYQFNFTWTQDRGALIVTRSGKQRSTPIFEINQFEGMVGVPEVSRGPDGLGVFVTTRINPYIRANSRINVKSEFATYNTGNVFVLPIGGDASANGLYNVLTMHYTGDTHGDDWNLNLDALRADITPQQAPADASVPGTGVTDGMLVWGARVDQAFRAKVREICGELGFDPNWLMAIMAFETGGTFNPAEPNQAGSGAVGLIQFTRPVARELGTTTGELSRMTQVEQLEFVKRYFTQYGYASRVKNLADCYMAVFWPRAIGKNNDYVLIDRDLQPIAYRQNRGLDKNDDGKITKAEAAERAYNSYIEGQRFIR